MPAESCRNCGASVTVGASSCLSCGHTAGIVAVDAAKQASRNEGLRALATLVQEAARNEYADALETWKLTDTKAQVTLAVSGVFLAGVLQFARDLTGNTPVTEQVLLLLSALATVAAAVCGLWTIRTRMVTAPRSAADLLNRARGVLETGDDDPETAIPHFIGEAAEGWIECSKGLTAALPGKQKWLERSQYLLLAGGACVGVLVASRVLRLFL